MTFREDSVDSKARTISRRPCPAPFLLLTSHLVCSCLPWLVAPAISHNYLHIYYAPGTVLGIGHTAMNRS